MLYGIIILATALILSLTAEYYSIMGLTAIFAAAVVPVIVMGASLGLGKVVATVWLHNNWKRIPWTFKSYLVPAIIFLMFLTSMGIFGYLSKAHLEQASLTGDSTAQVALFDEKIKTQKDNIESARLALKQMDATVDQTITRSTDVGSVQIASALRKRQQKERTDLQNEIGKSQTEIAKLQELRAPLAAQSRKIEAEVGPIKYIAALIYGDNPDSNLLERAVRWVIILIVMVFDPLALCLILAASLQFEWARHGKGGYVHDEEAPKAEDQFKLPEGIPTPYIRPPEPVVTSWTTTTTETIPESVPGEEEDDAVEEILEMPSEWDNKRHAFAETAPPVPVIDESVFDEPDIDVEELDLPHINTQPAELTPEEKVAELDLIIQDKIEHYNDPVQPEEFSPELMELADRAIVAIEEERDPEELIPTAMGGLTPEPELVQVAVEYIDPNTRIKTLRHDWVPAPIEADNLEGNVKVASDFGTTFPADAKKGDMYLRVDYLPTKLFKFNGQTWMHVEKTASDSYTFNEEYIKYLITKIDSGEYSLDDLTQTEQDQITEFLNNEQHD